MIEQFSQSRLRNEEDFQHKTEIRDILARYPSVTERLGMLPGEFTGLYDEADIAIEYIGKSDFTKLIYADDRFRDEITYGLFRHIDADAYHFDPVLRQEAVSLQNIKSRYTGITALGLDEQTASTYNLLQELNAKRDTLDRLHLSEWVGQLEAANKQVNERMKSRDAETASKPVSKMKQVRPKLDKTTADIFDTLDTLERIAPSEDLSNCMKEINVVNKRYADRLAQRSGRNAAAAEKARQAPDSDTLQEA